MPAAQVSTPGSTMSLLQDAAQAMTAGKLNRAETDLQTVLRTAPGDYRAVDLLGVVRVLQHRDVEAEQLFRRAVQKKADFAPALAHLGLLYLQKGRADDAVPQLREALRIDPARTDASDALVHILRDQSKTAAAAGDSSRSLALLREARNYAPDNPNVQFEFGAMALRSEEHTSELQSLRHLVCRLLLEKKKSTQLDTWLAHIPQAPPPQALPQSAV